MGEGLGVFLGAPGVPGPARVPRGAGRGQARPRRGRDRGSCASCTRAGRRRRSRAATRRPPRQSVDVRSVASPDGRDVTSGRRRRTERDELRAGRRATPRRRLRLPRLVHRRPLRRRGSRRRDVRARAAPLAPVRPGARLGAHVALPGRAHRRARPLPLRAPAHAARGARGACRSGSRSGSPRASRPSSSRRCAG